jgi:hypothetical protein
MNVIWIVSDTLRKKEVGAYGNETIHTPSMDALAAKSVRFDRAYIASFPTMPTRADHLTGRFTVSFMKWEALPKGEVTLPQMLNRARYNTAAMVDTPFYLRSGMNYDRGFSTFEEIPGQLWRARGSDPRFRNEYTGRRLDTDCFAPQTFSRAMQWLELNYKSDFFLYIDTWDPHEPWNAPDYYTELYWPGYDGEQIRSLYGYWPKSPDFTEEKVKKAHATYCGEVTMVDTWLGYLLRKVENMGLMENTAIIFVSDHGYYFGEHGGLYGKMVFSSNPEPGSGGAGIWTRSPYYEEVTAIPLFIYMPASRRELRRADLGNRPHADGARYMRRRDTAEGRRPFPAPRAEGHRDTGPGAPLQQPGHRQCRRHRPVGRRGAPGRGNGLDGDRYRRRVDAPLRYGGGRLRVVQPEGRPGTGEERHRTERGRGEGNARASPQAPRETNVADRLIESRKELKL